MIAPSSALSQSRKRPQDTFQQRFLSITEPIITPSTSRSMAPSRRVLVNTTNLTEATYVHMAKSIALNMEDWH